MKFTQVLCEEIVRELKQVLDKETYVRGDILKDLVSFKNFITKYYLLVSTIL